MEKGEYRKRSEVQDKNNTGGGGGAKDDGEGG